MWNCLAGDPGRMGRMSPCDSDFFRWGVFGGSINDILDVARGKDEFAMSRRDMREKSRLSSLVGVRSSEKLSWLSRSSVSEVLAPGEKKDDRTDRLC